jgi:WD40 repeat protein
MIRSVPNPLHVLEQYLLAPGDHTICRKASSRGARNFLLQKTPLFLKILPHRFMPAYKIFISSPGDVGRERHLAEQVIRRVAAEFQNRVEVQQYFWEYEPMESTRDYQENIPLTSAFDLVICILWKRLGSPLSVKHQRPDGGQWRSGTEFELVTAIESKKARGAPDIFIFKNDTKPTFEADEAGEGAKTELDLAQWKALIAFIKEWCEGVQDGQRVFTAALNRYQALDQFEQVLEKLLVGKLNERFPPAPDTSDSERRSLRPAAPTWTDGSPFRGLEAFQFLHAPVFCGRTHAIGEVLDRLRRKAAQGRPFVLILGASGSGKSSLAMAGVLPLLVKPGTIEGVSLWRRVVFRPGGQTEAGDLFDRLAAALVRRQQEGEGLPELISGSTTVGRLAADLRADPKAAAFLVRSALDQVAVLYRQAEAQKLRGWMAESQAENRTADVARYGRLLAELTPREARLALVIDQAEELFTADDLNRRPELRTGFAIALDALAASGVVFVLVTLRSDFYAQIQQLPAFVDLKESDGQFDLLPAQPAEIAQMIRQPALAAGLRFEQDQQTQEGLDEVLADQVKAEPRLLPLLEFALDELYKQRSAGGLLTFEAYRVHLDGSIVRALAKRADATLAGLPEPSRDAFRSVMRRLATTVDDTAAGSAEGPPLEVIQKGSSGPAFQRQRVPYDQLTAHPPGAKGLVDAFVAARLLVVETGKAHEQKAEVTVAHEALFAHWAALKNLLLAERDDLILPRARVAASHERWRAENRALDFLLPPGKQLSEAEQLLAEYGEELKPELKAYVAASMAQAHAQQKRRQRILIGALLMFALLAVGASAAAIFGFWQKRQAERQTVLAREAEHKTADASSRANVSLAQYMLEDGKDVLALAHLALALRLDPKNERAVALTAAMLIQANWAIPVAGPMRHDEAVFSAQFSADGQRVVTASFDKTARVWDAATGKAIGEPMRHEDVVLTAQFSADGKRVVTASQDKTARVWDAVTGKAIGEPIRHGDWVYSAQFSTDGQRVVTASKDKTARVWDAVSGKAIGEPMRHQDAVRSAQFSADGQRVVTASEDKTARVWDAATGKAAGEPMRHEDTVRSAQFSADGQRVVTASKDKTARVWDTATGKAIGEPMRHEDVVRSAQFSADGQRVVTASEDKTARVWDAATGKAIGEPMRHGDAVISAVFGPDDQRVVTASFDKTARVWDAATDKAIGEPMRHDGWVYSAQFSADGQRVVTASRDNTAEIWDAPIGKAIGEPMRHDGWVYSAQFDADGQRVVTASQDKTARIWDAATGTEIGEPMRHEDAVIAAQFSPDGQRVVTASKDKTARVWDTATGTEIGEPMRHEDAVLAAEFSADGQRVVTASEDKTAQVWEAATGRVIGRPMRHDGWVYSARFSADGQRVVTASEDKTARVWEAATGEAIGEPMRHEDAVLAAQFSADGQRVVTASEDKTAQVWNAATGKAIGEPMRHDSWIYSAQFGAQGQRVVTASEDKTARVWEAGTGKVIGEPMRHEDAVRSAQFSADGHRVVTASRDKTARVWDAATGKALGEPMRHDGWVNSAQFSADGQRVVTASWDKTAQVWDVPTISNQDTPSDVLLLADLAEAACGSVLQNYGQAEILRIFPADQVRAAREKIAAKFERQSSGLTPVERLLRWSVADPRRRTISPFSKLTVPEWIENRITDGTLEGLRAAVQFDPNNAVLAAHFGKALAVYALQKGTDPDEAQRTKGEADFQTRRALKLAPENEEVKKLRAGVVNLLNLPR